MQYFYCNEHKLILPRVKHIPERITPEIENNDSDKNRKSGEKHKPRSGLQLLASLIQHKSPFGSRRLAAESEERKTGKFHHHSTDIGSGSDNHER